MTSRALRVLALVLTLCLGAGSAAAQSPPIELRTGAAQGWRPTVQVNHLLSDRGLEEALASGLPLRLRLRVELWKDGVFDRLVEAGDVALAIVQDPLDRSYSLEDGRSRWRFETAGAVEDAIDGRLAFTMHPTGRGRFYYLARLEVETLSLSDLEELRRWLRGEARPVVEGRAPVERALERGLRRTVVRLIGLPARRYQTRTPAFSLR